jgi:hypothetical protein
MLLGRNTNVRHEGVVFHVQTEDSGVARPHVITHLYHQGTILASEKRSYAELVKRPDREERVRELMDEQHEGMLGKLRNGELDGMLRERLGGAFAGGPQARRAPARAAGLSSAGREETIPAPPGDPIAEAVLAVGRLGEATPTPLRATPTPAPPAARTAAKPAAPVPSPAPRATPAPEPRPAPPSAQRPPPEAAPVAAASARSGSVQRARLDANREQTVPEPTPRTFGDGIITDKPLDEVILAYLVEKARHRKRLPT